MIAPVWKMKKRLQPGKLVVGLALVSFFVSTMGMPLPATRFKDTFPCQDHACGCGSAEQCWQHCCCFTVQERWAWARDHAIAPPSYAELLPSQEASPENGTPVRCCHHHGFHRPASGFQGTKVFGFSALHCQGLATLWSGAALAVPPPPVSPWRPSLLPIGWVYRADFSPQAISISLLDPPPR
jgi:hypothetical protein